MNSELRPRPEVTDNIRKSVRQLAAQEKIRSQRKSRWEPVTRLFAPLGYAAAGSLLTLAFMILIVGGDARTAGTARIADSSGVASSGVASPAGAVDWDDARPTLGQERPDSPFVLPLKSLSVADGVGDPDLPYSSGYVTGYEDPHESRLVSYIY